MVPWTYMILSALNHEMADVKNVPIQTLSPPKIKTHKTSISACQDLDIFAPTKDGRSQDLLLFSTCAVVKPRLALVFAILCIDTDILVLIAE